MGRLEKIVVLTVLFLVAVVLGVALNTESPAPGRGADETAKLEGDAGVGNAGPLQPGGLLSAQGNVDGASGADKPAGTDLGGADRATPSAAPGTPPAAKETPAPLPEANPAPVTTPTPAANPNPAVAPFLATRDGLEPSNDPKLMFYTWKANDSFAGLAQTYYGSKDKLARLMKVNEGKSDANMKAGERIWVPVVDDSAATQTSLSGGKVYVVKQGDVLSGISKEFYGTAKKWQKILDANKDVLSRPEALRPGMKLRIPE